MSFRILYRPLFSLTIRPGFHLNKGPNEFDDLDASTQKEMLNGFDAFEDLNLGIPNDTREIMSGLGLLAKEMPSGFLVGAPVKEVAANTYQAERPPRDEFVLRFALTARAPDFWNYTNLRLDGTTPSIHYLSNRVHRIAGTFPYLPSPPPLYDAGHNYRPGDLARVSGHPQRFLATQEGAHAEPSPGADPNWVELSSRNYLSESDRISLRPAVFEFELPTDTATHAWIDLISENGTIHQVGQAIAGPGAVIPSVSVSAEQIPSGLYLLQVNGLDGGGYFNHFEPTYIDSELATKRVFAVVEIAHDPASPLGDYRLFEDTTDFELRHPEYQIHLLNRHTYWRYQFVTPRASDVVLVDIEKVDGEYVTRVAMPLTRGLERVRLTGEQLLPNPSVDRITPSANRVYSDIYI